MLAFRDVVRRYAAARALDGVSFQLPQGALVALVGANGAGKSTLLRLAAGLEAPDKGLVTIADAPASRSRARLAWLGQEPGLYDELTVRENLAFAARFFGRAHEVGAAAAALGIAHRLDARTRGLSRGERQRAALARALLGGEIMLLDEPTAALDADAATACIELLRELRGQRTILAATHDAELVKRADRVLRLDAGRLFT